MSSTPFQPRVTKVKLEENRQLVDCLLLKEPVTPVDFKLLYSKSNPVQKARHISQGTSIGWAKILSNNQFLAYVHVRYFDQNDEKKGVDNNNNNGDSSDESSDSDDNTSSQDEQPSPSPTHSKKTTKNTNQQEQQQQQNSRIELHELPHILCNHYYKDVTLASLIKTNNIRPPKPNAKIDPANPPPRLPLVPSFIYAQKRLFVKWRYEIAFWWSRHSSRLHDKKDKTLALLQQFQRANPEFRSVQTGKQWFYQLMKLFETDEKNKISIQSRLDTFSKEMKMASEGLRKQVDYVAPVTQRRVDQIREEHKANLSAKKAESLSKTTSKDEYDVDSSDSDSDSDDDSDSSSSDSDSSDDEVTMGDFDGKKGKLSTQTTTITKTTKQQQQSVIQQKKSSSQQQQHSSSSSSSSSSSGSDSDSDSSASSDDEVQLPPPVQPKKQQQQQQQQPIKKSQGKEVITKQQQQQRKNFNDSDSDSDSDSSDQVPSPPVKKASKQAVLPPTLEKKNKNDKNDTPSSNKFSSQPIKRKNFESSSDSDSDSDEEDVKPTKAMPVKKQRR